MERWGLHFLPLNLDMAGIVTVEAKAIKKQHSFFLVLFIPFNIWSFRKESKALKPPWMGGKNKNLSHWEIAHRDSKIRLPEKGYAQPDSSVSLAPVPTPCQFLSNLTGNMRNGIVSARLTSGPYHSRSHQLLSTAITNFSLMKHKSEPPSPLYMSMLQGRSAKEFTPSPWSTD